MPKAYDSVSQSSSGTSDWVLLNPTLSPWNVSIHAEATGTLTFDIEVTGDGSILGPDDSTPDAFKLANMTGLTASEMRPILAPIAAARINITSYTSGSVIMHVLQAGGAPR